MLVTKVNSIFNRTLGITAILGGILLGFMLFSVCLEVVLRYVVGRPTVWVTEITGYLLVYIPFLVAAWVLRREGHVRMDLVLNQLSPKTQSLVNVITSIVGAIVCLLIAWYGIKVTWDHYQTGFLTMTLLMLPKWPLLAVIPVGSFLLFIQLLRRTYNYLVLWRASRGKAQCS